MGPPPPSASGGSIDKPHSAGLVVGLFQGITPGGTMLDGSAAGALMGYKSNQRYELGMATGQVIGGLDMRRFSLRFRSHD